MKKCLYFFITVILIFYSCISRPEIVVKNYNNVPVFIFDKEYNVSQLVVYYYITKDRIKIMWQIGKDNIESNNKIDQIKYGEKIPFYSAFTNTPLPLKKNFQYCVLIFIYRKHHPISGVLMISNNNNTDWSY